MGVTLRSRLASDADARTRATHAAVQTAVRSIETGAKRRARVDTGEMRRRLRGEMTGAFAGRVVGGAQHTIYNEYGTRHMAAQPMLTPAAELAREPFHHDLRQAWS
jgi:HK97 gp10 family phage protein